MPKKRLIPLLFALAYIVVPVGAVYLQVTLSKGAAVHAAHAPAMSVTPAVLRAPPAEPDALVAL